MFGCSTRQRVPWGRTETRGGQGAQQGHGPRGVLRTGVVNQGLHPQPRAITLGVFSPDASAWVPPPPDCSDFDFSLGEDVAFGTCAVCPQPPESLQPCWRDAAEQHRQALGDALEENSQVGPGTGCHPDRDAGMSACSSGRRSCPERPVPARARSCRRPWRRSRRSWRRYGRATCS